MTLPRHGLAAASLVALAACATAAEPASAQDRSSRFDRETRADGSPEPNVVAFEFSTKTRNASMQGGQNQQGGQGQQGAQNAQQRMRNQQGMRARGGQGGDQVNIVALLAQANAPELARLVVTDPLDGPTQVDGTLLFDDVTALAAWRRAQMAQFLAPMGGEDAVRTTIRVVNKDVLSEYGLGGANAGLENLSITYTNTGNDTGGADADIDAVTVVCPGDFAECSPSN